jgi:hypothetical protein
MSQAIKSNEFGHGAGKGDDERPVDRIRYRQNYDAIKKLGLKGTLTKTKGGKTTYKYR